MSKKELTGAKCANCETELVGLFCHQCGQKKMLNRFSMKVLTTEVLKKLFDVDSGFWYTIKSLTLHPAKVVNDYLVGIHKRYAKPISFFLLSTALVFFIISLASGYKDGVEQFETGFNMGGSGEEMPPEIKAAMDKIGKWMQDARIYFIISIPIFAFVFKFSFRKQKLNYAENIIFLLFTYGNANFLSLPILLLGSFVHIYFLTVVTLFSVIYLVWAMKRFYQTSWVRAIMVYSLATILYMLAFVLFVGGAIVVLTFLGR